MKWTKIDFLECYIEKIVILKLHLTPYTKYAKYAKIFGVQHGKILLKDVGTYATELEKSL